MWRNKLTDGGRGRGGSPTRPRAIEVNRPYLKSTRGFALYEVLIGLTIFLVGVLALGRAVENCLNASTLSAEEDRIREILSNKMAEIQTMPGRPDESPSTLKIETGYGPVRLLQKSARQNSKEENGTLLDSIYLG